MPNNEPLTIKTELRAEDPIRNENSRHHVTLVQIKYDALLIAKPYKCEICDTRSTTITALNLHYWKKHRPHKKRSSKSFQCEICNHASTTETALYQHKWRSHKPGHLIKQRNRTESFKCEICKYRYTSKLSLYKHKLRKHNSPYRCIFCDHTFKTETELNLHCQGKNEKNQPICLGKRTRTTCVLEKDSTEDCNEDIQVKDEFISDDDDGDKDDRRSKEFF